MNIAPTPEELTTDERLLKVFLSILEDLEGKEADAMSRDEHADVSRAMATMHRAGMVRMKGAKLFHIEPRGDKDVPIFRLKDWRYMLEQVQKQLQEMDPEEPVIRPRYELKQDSGDLVIHLPGPDPATHEISLGLDYYGVTPRLQVLCFDKDSDEPQVSVRYNACGQIVEVYVEGADIRVLRYQEPSAWQKERDTPTPS